MKIFDLQDVKLYEEKYQKTVLTLKDLEKKLNRKLKTIRDYDELKKGKLFRDFFYKPSKDIMDFCCEIIEGLDKVKAIKILPWHDPDGKLHNYLWDHVGRGYHISFGLDKFNKWIKDNIVASNSVDIEFNIPQPLPEGVSWNQTRFIFNYPNNNPMPFKKESKSGQLFDLLIRNHCVYIKNSEVIKNCLKIETDDQLRSAIRTLKTRQFKLLRKQVVFKSLSRGEYRVTVVSN